MVAVAGEMEDHVQAIQRNAVTSELQAASVARHETAIAETSQHCMVEMQARMASAFDLEALT